MSAENLPLEGNVVRLAENQEEIEAAQCLRYTVFYEEYGAKPATDDVARLKMDIDPYDAYTDHLVVLNEARKIVGTYRLLKRSVAEAHDGFYSAGEYDLSPLLQTNQSILELGRSCVLPEYRTKQVLQLLWQGIADYISENNVDLLFGCASLHGTVTDELKTPLSYLYHYHLADPALCPRALDARYVDMNRIPKDEIDAKRAFVSLPPLIKGYLRAGAIIGDGAVIDYDFNTTDVFVMMPTELIAERYRKHYERKLQKDLPGVGSDKDAQDIVSALGIRGTT